MKEVSDQHGYIYYALLVPCFHFILTRAARIAAFLIKGDKMAEKDVSLGGVNKLVIKSDAGVASVSLSASAPNAPGVPSFTGTFSMSERAVFDAFLAWVESKSPDAVKPIEAAFGSIVDAEIQSV